jgi:hypothetical protein
LPVFYPRRIDSVLNDEMLVTVQFTFCVSDLKLSQFHTVLSAGFYENETSSHPVATKVAVGYVSTQPRIIDVLSSNLTYQTLLLRDFMLSRQFQHPASDYGAVAFVDVFFH